ncbi:unnamed protein product [Phytomonas sp. EM1]|nr:unnamed protein product [Phytomonas sp. EM1]|eukprot:CCW63779.1 unnamed protein product [Phytomonas sp. isolate EM1]
MVNKEASDFTQFVKYLNNSFPAPSSNAVNIWVSSVAPEESTASHVTSPSHSEFMTLTRTADSSWRALTVSDSAVKESSKLGGNHTSGERTMAGSTTVVLHYPSITVGRMMVSTEDRWRIHAQMRREEAKSGQMRKEYNKKVTRAIKTTKGPQPEGFPPGRGRPV